MNKSNIIIIAIIASIIIVISSFIVYSQIQISRSFDQTMQENKKVQQESEKVLQKGKQTIKETNKVLCDSLIREYYKDPDTNSKIPGLTLADILNSDTCKNK